MMTSPPPTMAPEEEGCQWMSSKLTGSELYMLQWWWSVTKAQTSSRLEIGPKTYNNPFLEENDQSQIKTHIRAGWQGPKYAQVDTW